MKTATFSCPHCSSPLRIRDRAFVEREVGCPECGNTIQITLDQDEATATKIKPTKQEADELPRQKPPGRYKRRPLTKKKSKVKKPVRSHDTADNEDQKTAGSRLLPRINRNPLFDLGDKFAGVPEVLLSPVGIAWSVAGLVALILLIMAWPSSESTPAQDPADKIANHETIPESNAASNPENSPDSEEFPIPEPPSVAPLGNEDEFENQLKLLGESIRNYTEQRGQFPVGTISQGQQPMKDRFSWLADLIVQQEQNRIAPPQWDQPWNDPLNDRFVRRQLEPFLNPLVAQRTGEDRYPTTHFVGVAGVGADAPKLPVDHPRAGIFGFDRITREADITDGLANTMMVAGVNQRLGSWASGGSPSMRALTKEPYFNGPDGFGTGQSLGMSVLMADGSVRFLSKNISPVIMRRMAAMADGLALDGTIPGEPGEKPKPLTPNEPKPPVIAKEKAEPPKAPIAKVNPEPMPLPEEPKTEPEDPVDIAAALAVPIVKFEQVQGVPFLELLFQVEEMCGVPIKLGKDVPGVEADIWKQPVSMKLKETTVQKILDALVQKGNLRYSVEKNHIQLHSAQ